MNEEIKLFNHRQTSEEQLICTRLAEIIDNNLPQAESKIWHGHPVWFLDGNPIVGYNKLKNCIRLLFWSGQTFEEQGLTSVGKFKAAEVRYTNVNEIVVADLVLWLKKSEKIQWDYKNIRKRKGHLERLIEYDNYI